MNANLTDNAKNQGASNSQTNALEWLQSREFYELCQQYRHASDPIAAPGHPTAAEAFERLKLAIADAFIPVSGGPAERGTISEQALQTARIVLEGRRGGAIVTHAERVLATELLRLSATDRSEG